MTARHVPSTAATVVRLAHVEPHTTVLGPGSRTAIYVQGCHLRCRGCAASAWLDFEGGSDVAVEDLFERLMDAGTRAITISGGEPMMQPLALVALVDRLTPAVPELSVMVYTGHRIERLRAAGTDAQRALLARTDILVDSPYVERWHGDLRWRGSHNQRLLLLTERHSAAELEPDVGAGLEIVVGRDLRVHQIGVPYRPSAAEQRPNGAPS